MREIGIPINRHTLTIGLSNLNFHKTLPGRSGFMAQTTPSGTTNCKQKKKKK